MDKKTLSQYRALCIEYEQLQKRIKMLNKKLERLDREGVVTDTVTGGEGGIQHFTIRGYPMRDYSKNKTSLLNSKMRYETLSEQIDCMKNSIEEFINGIDDATTRIIYRHYYIDGMSQEKIAHVVGLDQSRVSRRLGDEFKKYSKNLKNA